MKLSHPQKIGLLALMYFAVSLSICYFKYTHLLYNLTDLGIFTNALRQPWSNFLYSTIQGHSYLGDHLAPYLLLIKPIFNLWPNSLNLLILQISFFTISVWPLYLITKKLLTEKQQFFIITLFLFNPITIGINLNEFHNLTLALPLLLFTWYFYTEKKFRAFIIFFLATLIVREDLALTLIPFSLFSILEKRDLKWKLLPLISIPYFIIALKVISYFRGSGYGFLSYYGWLGSSLPEIVNNLFLNWNLVLLRFMDIRVFEFLLVSLLFTLLLPLLRPKYLLFGLLPYLVLVLGPGKGVVILKFQYAIPILFALLLASIYGLESLTKKYAVKFNYYKSALIICSIISLVYLNHYFGPYLALAKKVSDPNFQVEVQSRSEILGKLTASNSTLSSTDFLAYNSTRELYNLSYVFSGNQQFGGQTYQLPSDLNEAIINFNEVLLYSITLPAELYNQGSENFRDAMESLVLVELKDSVALFNNSQTPTSNPQSLIMIDSQEETSTKIDQQIEIIPDQLYLTNKSTGSNNGYLESTIVFEALQQPADNYQLSITFYGQGDEVLFQKYYSLDYGLLPASTWPADSTITAKYSFQIPQTQKPLLKATLSLVKLQGYARVSNLSSAQQVFEKIKTIGPEIPLLDFSIE